MWFVVFGYTSLMALLLILWSRWQVWRQRRLLDTVPVCVWDGLASAYLNQTRDITIFLPPDFESVKQKANLLLVNDGQDCEVLRVRQTLAELFQRNQVAPIIVVAIPVGEERLQEYGTAVAPNAQELGCKAEAYARFVTQELLPLLRERLGAGITPRQTAICGASLGGLSAFDLAWNHPDLFGTVGVFSGSFWWRASATEERTAPGRRIAHEMVRRTARRNQFRGWFQAGTLDETSDRDNNGVIDAIQDTQELILEITRLKIPEQEILYREVSGGRHNYDTWAELFPEFLRWVFPS